MGRPVPAGTVTFFVGNQVATAPINEDGSYKALNVPLGEAKVSVQTPAGSVGDGGMSAMAKQMGQKLPNDIPQLSPGGQSGGGAPAKAVAIPKQYHDPSTSGLTATIKGGKNTFDIELK